MTRSARNEHKLQLCARWLLLINVRKMLTHCFWALWAMGTCKVFFHMPELGKMSRRGHRQVLLDKLTWLLCKRVQSLQVRAELLHSPHGDLAASFRVGWFFFPHSLNLKWDQVWHTGPTNTAWHYCCGTAESWCLLIFFYKELCDVAYFGVGVEAGWGKFPTPLPQIHKWSLNLKPFSLWSLCLACRIALLVTCEETCLCVFFPLAVHTP